MNPLTLAVSKVLVGETGSATGFFYKNGDDIFLVTNKHVVRNKDGYNNLTIFPNFILKNNQVNSGFCFKIPADVLATKSYHHIKKEVDISVIWIIGNNGIAQNLQAITNDIQAQSICCINDLEQTDICAEVADSAFIIGYPHGYSAETGRRHGSPKPIWKCGTIATEMSLNFDAGNYGSFLIDATGQAGNSGSPVVAYGGVGSGMFKTSTGGVVMQAGGGLVYKLLGIMSAILIQPTTSEKSDLCLVWKKKLIDEILNNIKSSAN